MNNPVIDEVVEYLQVLSREQQHQVLRLAQTLAKDGAQSFGLPTTWFNTALQVSEQELQEIAADCADSLRDPDFEDEFDERETWIYDD
ncbi:MAG: hypothetical protein AAGG51_03320 [Cyanobacteria bacterium P01_G01_bin.54]